MTMKKIPKSILLLVYTKEKDVLLLKKKGHDDMWQSITGSLLQNEKPIDAAIRELHEETGISSSILSIVISIMFLKYMKCGDINMTKELHITLNMFLN